MSKTTQGRRKRTAILKAPHTPILAIRKMCRECCGGGYDSVTYCGAVDSCPLWFYRFGKRPTKNNEMFVVQHFQEGGKFWAKVQGE